MRTSVPVRLDTMSYKASQRSNVRQVLSETQTLWVHHRMREDDVAPRHGRQPGAPLHWSRPAPVLSPLEALSPETLLAPLRETPVQTSRALW